MHATDMHGCMLCLHSPHSPCSPAQRSIAPKVPSGLVAKYYPSIQNYLRGLDNLLPELSGSDVAD